MQPIDPGDEAQFDPRAKPDEILVATAVRKTYKTGAGTVRLRGLGADTGPLRLTEYRIDPDHANVLGAWERLGRPDTPTREQLAELRTAAELRPSPQRAVEIGPDGELTLTTALRGGSVVFFDLDHG